MQSVNVEVSWRRLSPGSEGTRPGDGVGGGPCFFAWRRLLVDLAIEKLGKRRH